MPALEFDFSATGTAPGGWRLHRLEMANWGTFGGGQVHCLLPESGWTLLVGQNGSGKSTAVDALRTLLAPRSSLHHSFNDAAGGQKRKDRTLSTYIRGAWAAHRDEDDAPAEPKFLRREEMPTYLLAVFRNARRQAALTLAQILWVANGEDETVYLVGAGELGVASHLQGLETGRGMKKELARRGFDVRETYKAYREDFCSRMGIPGEGALEIFNQAIGVKEVTDVSIFLRRNLLAPGAAIDFIHEQVIPRFADLESCWNDIERAEAQITLLAPVADAYAEVQEWEKRREGVSELQRALPRYYLQRHVDLLREYLDRCALELSSAKAERAELEAREKDAQGKRDLLKAQLDADETSRLLEKIGLEIETVKLRAQERQRHHDQLENLLRQEELGTVPGDNDAFVLMRTRFAARVAELAAQHDAATIEANERGVEAVQLRESLSEQKAELEALAGRQALIPGYLQQIRSQLCAAVQVPVDTLPFAGELMEVKPEFAEEWSGALERLLHGFGISLLVPEKHYASVAHWVNGRRLVTAGGDGVRLLFHRVPGEFTRTRPNADPRVVSARMNYRDEHPLARWVAFEVASSFPHACCRDIAELEGERFGLTKEGLVRHGTRHVKDDRRGIGARRDYVLGWSPERKVQAIRQQMEIDAQAFSVASQGEKDARQHASKLDQRSRLIQAADQLPGFASIDFSAEQSRLLVLVEQRTELEKSSKKRDILKTHFEDAEEALRRLRKDREEVGVTVRLKEGQLKQFQPELERKEEQLQREDARDFTALAPAYLEAEGEVELTHLNVGEVRERVDKTLRGRASNFTAKINEAALRIIKPMQQFLGAYPSESKQLDARPEYAEEFVRLYEQLVREDLPRHKERFRDFLNTNLMENIGGLESKLNDEVKTHRERIAQVNGALGGLEYGDGTFVELVRRDTRDAAIRDFRARLRDCLSTGFNLDEHQRLELYKKVREIVSRFSKEPDWLARVADSRLWLEFSVNERRKSDGVQVDSLDSSTGKSGGQKAKMAFTILAASLLAQYGMADDPDRADSLRLVVVDEVFARTDATNSHRALDLFQRLGFQLLLAAPWKAEARIAERYVESFHLTVNPGGDASRVQRATRAQYEEASRQQPETHV